MRVPIRDKGLLDTIEEKQKSAHSGIYWRLVREGRNPTGCSRSGGRWDDKTFDVLYLSSTKEGALAEIRFHLFKGQPIPPSKVKYELFEIQIKLSQMISFPDLRSLKAAGLNTSNFNKASYANKDAEYPRSQEIAEACFFLGSDGVLVPSAQHSSPNLVVFCEQDTFPSIETITNHGLITW